MPALKDVLEGKPFHTPIHPILVHLPIALFPLASVLDVIGVLTAPSGAPLVRAAFVCLVGGIGTALLAAIFGLVDYTDIRDDNPAKRTATAHLVLNLVAVGLFAASAGLRYDALDVERVGAVALVVSLLGVVVLSYSGYLGGKLVYVDGVGVGRHRRKTRLPESTLFVVPKGDAAVVANDAELVEGETLRVSVNGTVVTLARVKGTVHAFQEFCTHRHGPLSEGRLEGCEVTCPWHRSRFDVRTGKVIDGPAKIDLRTFRTEVRGGKIVVFVEGGSEGKGSEGVRE